MASSASHEKICISCKQDVTDRPRLNDAQGRYLCVPCAERHKAGRAANAASPPTAAEGEILGVEGLDDAIAHQPTACPSCGHALNADAVVCLSCGFNRSTGAAVRIRFVQGAGTDVDEQLRAERRRERDRAARDMLRRETVKPIIMFAAAVVLIVAGAGMSAMVSHSDFPLGSILFNRAMEYTITLPIGLGVYWMCAAMWIGFDAPLPIVAMRLVAIYAMADATRAWVSWFPVLGWLIPMGVYVGLLMSLLDLDALEAIIVAFATYFIKFAVILWLLVPYVFATG